MSIGRIRGAVKESRSLYQEDLSRRQQASGILSDTGLYEDGLHGELLTTLGGETRAITSADLAEFRRRSGVVRSRSTKNKIISGITPLQIIAFARPSPNIVGNKQKRGSGDIDRANREINMAVLASCNKGKLRFITNAGGSTPNVTRHHVNISLPAYAQAKAMPKRAKDVLSLGKQLANSPLKFECDCGRHTFWFRYVASIGGWCEGRVENGYPKVRNPRLIGVACKHVLRVMREMNTSVNVHRKIGSMLLQESPIRTKQVDADRMSKQQKRKPKAISQKDAKAAIKKIKAMISEKAKSKTAARKKSNGLTAELERQIAQLNNAFDIGVIDKKTRDDAVNRIKNDG